MICCIFNVGPHYRLPIYQKMAESFDVEFYLGDKAGTNIKTFNYSDLKGYKRTLKRVGIFGNWYWMSGVCGLAFKKYDTYIVTGEPFCVSVWIFLILAKLQRKTTIAWTHGWYGRETGIKKVIKKTFFRLFSKTMCYNDYSRSLMVQQGFNGNKLFVIHNSLDYDAQLKLRHQIISSDIYTRHFGNNNKTLLFIGRLTEVKRLDMLIQAVAKLKLEGKQYNIVLVGDGVMKDALQKQAAEAGVNVWFYGACYDERTNAELIYNADLCVAPGNVGLTAMHTMVFGTPVITHNDFKWQMPEFEAIKAGETGDFFTRGDVDSLSKAIERWFDAHGNDRNKVRQACYKEIDEQWNPVFQLDVIEKAINI